MSVVAGAAVGAVAGFILAVNMVIYLGPEQGYESNVGEIFDHSAILGVATLAVLVAGPVVGIVIADRMRRQSSDIGRTSNR